MKYKNLIYSTWLAVLGAFGTASACLDIDDSTADDTHLRAHVVPTLILGNPPCPVGTIEFKIDDPTSGTFNIPGTSHSVTVTTDGVYFDWESTLGMDYVIAKGGPNANLYTYDPPMESFGDTNLSSPDNNGMPFGLSHISFCYDLELEVMKTANTTFRRSWSWNIIKDGDQTMLTLQEGQTFIVNYVVNLFAESMDSNFSVSGEISIHNPADVTATITSVDDIISGAIVAMVDCPVTFPHNLPANGDLVCTYSAALPDDIERTNTVTVTTSGPVGGSSAMAAVVFGEPSEEIDECVDVTDSVAGPLGTVCVGDLSESAEFSYSLEVSGPCGTTTFTNIAKSTTNDTSTMDSDSHDVVVEVDCNNVCTLTQGYWKTHSEYGPAPYDDTWALLANGADTLFLNSGMSYYEVLWAVPSGGNSCLSLAHQTIAAMLNGLAGADTSTIDATLAAAVVLLESVGDLSQCPPNVRPEARELAMILDAYNNGNVGPEHCSE